MKRSMIALVLMAGLSSVGGCAAALPVAGMMMGGGLMGPSAMLLGGGGQPQPAQQHPAFTPGPVSSADHDGEARMNAPAVE
jgi:hypothetical protein